LYWLLWLFVLITDVVKKSILVADISAIPIIGSPLPIIGTPLPIIGTPLSLVQLTYKHIAQQLNSSKFIPNPNCSI